MIKIVYIILAHQYPDQFIRLVQRLNTSTSFFIVHIDKKTDNIVYNKMVQGVHDFQNVIFIKRHSHYWGDFTHTRATIEGIKEVFARKLEFDYLFLLTGQDYPIKTNGYIENFLYKNKGKQFIHHFKVPPDPGEGWGWEDENGGLNRIENWHVRLFNTIYRIPGDGKANSPLKSIIKRFLALFLRKRKFINGFKLFGGSSYWCITKDCAEYINTFVNKNNRFVNFFKYTCIPDEIFFQTIVLNSPFRADVVNDDLRCIDWSAGGSHPRIWRKDDIAVFGKSSGLIARKFDASIDSTILDLIDIKFLSKQPRWGAPHYVC